MAFAKTSLKVALSMAIVGGSLSLAGAAQAAPTFSEKDFPSNTYTLTASYTSGDGDISPGQCHNCGVADPTDASGHKALRFLIDGGPSYSTAAIGVIFNNFSYNPSGGMLGSVTFAVDKNLIYTGGVTSNTFRPLIEQNGVYYWAGVSLPPFAGTGASGFEHASATLSASNFTSYNFDTGVAGTAHPDFSSGLMQFGIAQYSTGYTGATTIYDNFAVTTNAAVPEPTTWAMMLVGFGMVGFGLRYRRKSVTARLA